MKISMSKIRAGALDNGFDVTENDVAAAVINLFFCDADTGYKLTHDAKGCRETTAMAFFRSPKMEYVLSIIKPLVTTQMRSYLKDNPSEFADMIKERTKKTEALEANEKLAKFVSANESGEEMSKDELDDIIQSCLRNPSLLQSNDPYTIKAVFDMASKFKKDRFPEEVKQVEQIVVLPAPKTYICPHTQKECYYKPNEKERL